MIIDTLENTKTVIRNTYFLLQLFREVMFQRLVLKISCFAEARSKIIDVLNHVFYLAFYEYT